MRGSPRLVVIPTILAAVWLSAPAGAALNPQIAGLQVALRSHGVYSGKIDAVAGPMTARAVRTFQRRSGLKQSGAANFDTRMALGRLGRPLFGKRALKAGQVGWDVAVLQYLLSTKGFPTGIKDGYFGTETVKAVRRYQRAAGLRPDGVAGQRTIAALTGERLKRRAQKQELRATYVVKPGDTLTDVAARFGTTVGELASANGLDLGQFVLIGAKLKVPGRTTRHLSVRSIIDRWSSHYGVNPSLARALAWQESGFQSHVVSNARAWGVMQVTPGTWSFVETVLVGKPVARTTEGNVRVGVAFLDHLLATFDGNERLAVAAYYQGPKAVKERGLFGETEQFVANVLALKQRM